MLVTWLLHVVDGPTKPFYKSLLLKLLNNQLFTQLKILDKLIKKVINRKFTNWRLVAQWVWHRRPGTQNQGAFFCFRVESACANEYRQYLEKWGGWSVVRRTAQTRQPTLPSAKLLRLRSVLMWATRNSVTPAVIQFCNNKSYFMIRQYSCSLITE